MNRMFLFIFAISNAISLIAAKDITISVFNSIDNKALDDCKVYIIYEDSTIYRGTTDKNGEVTVIDIIQNNPNKEKYLIEAECAGFDIGRKFVKNDTTYENINLFLTPLKIIHLEEYVVEADKSEIIKQTSNGQVFFLSRSAKAKTNPFIALKEIPLLVTDANNSSITTIDGKTPLILINGMRINSGIAPLSPDKIESVEVITNPSARYLKEGYSAVVNIKITPSKELYQWYQVATSHDIPLCKGMGVGYLEIGNATFSVYGRTAIDYTYHENIESRSFSRDISYIRQLSQTSSNDGYSWAGELMLKYTPTGKDYFAIYGYTTISGLKTKSEGSGSLDFNALMQDSYHSKIKNKSNLLTSSIYYSHYFSNNNQFELRGAYNYNCNKNNSSRTEIYNDNKSITNSSDFHNIRHSGSLKTDWNYSYTDVSTLSAGIHSYLRIDRLSQISNTLPDFRHNQYSQYLYVGWATGISKKLFTNISAGLDCIWTSSDGLKNHYIRPRISFTGKWLINRRNAVSLGYNLNNTSPDISSLNPLNTSTDPLVICQGNPYLTPQSLHYLPITYSLSLRGWYISPKIYYQRIDDLISPFGYTDDKGLYVSTIRNYGHINSFGASFQIFKRIKEGTISGSVSWQNEYIPGQKKHSSVTIYGDFYYPIKKFTLNAYVTWTNRQLFSQSITRNFAPQSAIQVNYNFTDDFYIGFSLRYVTGKIHSQTTTTAGSYYNCTDVFFKEYNLHPWFIIRYTFRKNEKNKIKIGNVLQSEENGIKL